MEALGVGGGFPWVSTVVWTYITLKTQLCHQALTVAYPWEEGLANSSKLETHPFVIYLLPTAPLLLYQQNCWVPAETIWAVKSKTLTQRSLQVWIHKAPQGSWEITSVIQERDGCGLDQGGMLKKFTANAQIVVIFYKEEQGGLPGGLAREPQGRWQHQDVWHKQEAWHCPFSLCRASLGEDLKFGLHVSKFMCVWNNVMRLLWQWYVQSTKNASRKSSYSLIQLMNIDKESWTHNQPNAANH